MAQVFVEQRGEPPTAVKSTLFDPVTRVPREFDVIGAEDWTECSQVLSVLRPIHRILREELQRDEMSGARDRDRSTESDVEVHGRLRDLALDPGRSEEEVEEEPVLVVTGRPEACRRESTRGDLFDDRHEREAGRLETMDELLGIAVLLDGNREVDVAREAGVDPG